MKVKVESIREQLEAGLADLQSGRVAGLDEARNRQLGIRALLQNEARRLERKHGKEHPRVRRLATRLESNLEVVQTLEAEAEIARITVPEVGAEAALVHGRIVDRRSRGIAGLAVCLTDSRGQPIADLPSAASDRSGYYALHLGDAAFEILKNYRAGAFLAVFGGDGKAVYRSKQSLPIEPGARLVEEVTLARRPTPSDGRPKRRRKAAAKTAYAQPPTQPPKPKARRKKSASKKASRPKREK